MADKNEIQTDPLALAKAKNNLEEAFLQLLYLGLAYEEAKAIALNVIDERRPIHD